MSDMIIDGPAGVLQARFCHAGQDTGAVLCHPHPQYGGSMDDMVLQAIAPVLREMGVSTVEFNFRGVGSSAGSFDDGKGEIEDVKSVVQWLKTSEGIEEICLVGYSFGAIMALQAIECTGSAQLILVAPPISMFGEITRPDVNSLVILGQADQFVDATATSQWFSPDNTRIELIADADHFFFGAHEALSSIVRAYLTKQ